MQRPVSDNTTRPDAPSKRLLTSAPYVDLHHRKVLLGSSLDLPYRVTSRPRSQSAMHEIRRTSRRYGQVESFARNSQPRPLSRPRPRRRRGDQGQRRRAPGHGSAWLPVWTGADHEKADVTGQVRSCLDFKAQRYGRTRPGTRWYRLAPDCCCRNRSRATAHRPRAPEPGCRCFPEHPPSSS